MIERASLSKELWVCACVASKGGVEREPSLYLHIIYVSDLRNGMQIELKAY